MKSFFISIIFILFAEAQYINIHADFEQSDQIIKIRINFELDSGYHIYGFKPYGDLGPVFTSFQMDSNIQNIEIMQYPQMKEVYDKGFERNVEWVYGKSDMVIKAKSGRQIDTLNLKVKFQVCTDSYCLLPKEITVKASKVDKISYEKNSSNDIVTYGTKSSGLLSFIVLAIIMGFTALLTPCVFPMVPITVSFFLKSNENKQKKALKNAIVYGFGIISSFTILGFLISIIYGAQGVQNLAANPFVNLSIALLFIAFALSLFGLFEIRLPHSLLNKVNRAGLKPGYSGSFFAGIAFSLVSFTCTVAFVGLLLVDAASGEWLYPLLGMFFFSASFSLPFIFLALFPQKLSKLPKSGTWLERTKVIMAFLELAAAVKFISQADLVWNLELINRDFMLIIWASIALFIALYLIDFIKLHPVEKIHMTVGRLFLTMFFTISSIYLFSGLGNKPLQADLDSYLPPNDYAISQQSLNKPYSEENIDLHNWIENYQLALEDAKRNNRDLFVDFTGKTCTNCRWMEKNIFTRLRVSNEFKNFTLTRLWTDFGEDKVFNQNLEQTLFNTVALPLYAIIGPDGNVKRSFVGMTRNEEEFLSFLKGN